MASWEDGKELGEEGLNKDPGDKEPRRGWLDYEEWTRGNTGRHKGLGGQEGTTGGKQGQHPGVHTQVIPNRFKKAGVSVV